MKKQIKKDNESTQIKKFQLDKKVIARFDTKKVKGGGSLTGKGWTVTDCRRGCSI